MGMGNLVENCLRFVDNAIRLGSTIYELQSLLIVNNEGSKKKELQFNASSEGKLHKYHYDFELF